MISKGLVALVLDKEKGSLCDFAKQQESQSS
jgi:hypothetical protein